MRLEEALGFAEHEVERLRESNAELSAQVMVLHGAVARLEARVRRLEAGAEKGQAGGGEGPDEPTADAGAAE